MNSIWHLARKEFSDGLRNRWLLAIAIVFTIFALGIAWFGAAASGEIGFSSIPTTIASLASLASFLTPLIALLLAYDAIVGEEEGGTLLLLLSYPLSRGQLLLGKFLGHALILALAIGIGFGAAGLAIAFLVEDINRFELAWAFGRFMLSSTLLGWVFLALAYSASSWVSEKSKAAGVALGIWFLFVLVFDLALLGLLVGSQGQLSPQLLPWLLLANPTDIFRLLNLAGFQEVGPVTGILALGKDLPVGNVALWICLLAWVLVPLLIAYVLLRRRPL